MGSIIQQESVPFLQPSRQRSIPREVMYKTLFSVAYLANLLPTGPLLAFTFLTPIFTSYGSCDQTTQVLTTVLLTLLSIAFFLSPFIHSFEAPDGNSYYGFATPNSFRLFYYPDDLSLPDELSTHRIRTLHWIHAVLSVLVFFVVALKDKNAVSCFFPAPNQGTKKVLDILSTGIGFVCGLLFLMFPVRRHRIRYPISGDQGESADRVNLRRQRSIPREVMYKTLSSVANLANLLPTGPLLAFTFLTPIFTSYGSCDQTTQVLTTVLLILLSIAFFLSPFIHSFEAPDGNFYRGVATPNGFWLFYYPDGLSLPDDINTYRIRTVHWIRAGLSVLVFFAVALKDKNAVSCFFPAPDQGTKKVLDILPTGIGFVCGLLFLKFRVRRNGIRNPISGDQDQP